jgi:hypothetical protein
MYHLFAEICALPHVFSCHSYKHFDIDSFFAKRVARSKFKGTQGQHVGLVHFNALGIHNAPKLAEENHPCAI